MTLSSSASWVKFFILHTIFELWMLPATVICNIPISHRYISVGLFGWWLQICYSVWNFHFKFLLYVAKQFNITHWLVALQREFKMHEDLVYNKIDNYEEGFRQGK